MQKEHRKHVSIFQRVGQFFWCAVKNISELPDGPRYWRKTTEDLGGGIIKLAQILAMRYDLLPPRYCREFSHLFDRVTPMGWEDVVAVFQEEFGDLPEQIFPKFSYRPYATASFGQVHRGQLPDGTEVAIKVQKPGIQARVYADIAIIKFFAAIVETFFRTPVNVRDAISEWETWTHLELDYTIEAKNASRFKKTNTASDAYIPRVFGAYSTSRILVTEFLRGPNLNEIVQGKKSISQEKQKKLACQIVRAHLRHYLHDGFFHADPHLGNLIVMEDGRIGFVDFGIMGESKKDFQSHHLANFIKYAAHGNSKQAAAHFREFSGDTLAIGRAPLSKIQYHWKHKSPQQLERGVVRFLEGKFADIIKRWEVNVENTEGSLSDRSSARHFLSLVSLARRFGLEVPMSILSFIRSLIIIDMVCLALNQEFNMKEEINAFFSEYPALSQVSAPTRAIPQPRPIKTSPSVMDEREIEREHEQKQRFLERYIEQATRILEQILEEGSRGLAYFSTTKLR